MKINNHVFFTRVKDKLFNCLTIDKKKDNISRVVLLFTLVLLVSCSPESLEVRQHTMPSTGLANVVQSDRGIPVVGQADVVVAGGGVAGVAAALSAAEEGLSVILIESRNYFGYELTSTYNCRTGTGLPASSTPLAQVMCGELSGRKILVDNQLDPRELRSYLHGKIVGQPLIQVYLYSLVSGVVLDGKRVRGVVFSGRDGRQVVLASSVIDATEDARLATAAGASLLRSMDGVKTARRFLAIRNQEYLLPGPRAVPGSLGISGDSIMVYNGFAELAVSVHVAENMAGDLSAIHSQTLEKSFALREHLTEEGLIIEEDVRLEGSTPRYSISPETWIDEMPVVACHGQFSEQEIAVLDFSRSPALMPVGLEGLVIAGRTVDASPRMGSLQALLGVGELAGLTAAELAGEVNGYPDLVIKSPPAQESSGALQVCELLGGIEPGVEYPRIRQSATELPVRGEYDVLVVGGGTSGAIAAIAAARQGARVAVIEILPNLGGMGSNRVNTYYWGVPWKSLLRLELGDRVYLNKATGMGPLEKVRLSGEDKKYALQDLALRSGVQIYYQSLGTGAVIEGNQVRGVVVENFSGRHVLLADVVIDATGHAGIAVAAGAGYVKGRDTDGFLHEIEHGPLRDPTHLGDISTSYIKYTSPAVSLNIRESRRLLGDYVVTFKDVLHERLFHDNICRWRSNYDTHFPSSANQSDMAQDWVAILGQWRRPILGSIPYRSILPKGLDNILVAAMAYSTDHDALIGGRMQSDLEHLGEAAGVAAAMASRMQVSPREVPLEELQVELVKLGVLRDEDVPGRVIPGGPSDEELYRQDLWKKEREEQIPPEVAGTAPSLLWTNFKVEDAISKLGTDAALDAMVNLYLSGEEPIPFLQPLLESDKRRVREEAAVLLGILGDRSAVPVLLEFLNERNTRRFEYKLRLASSRPSVPLYWSSVILLGRFGEKDAVPAMLVLLSSPPPPGEFGDLTRSAYGVDMFENTETCPPPLASFIITALGRIGDPGAADVIRPYLAVSNEADINRENRDFEITWGVQTNAAWALAQLGDLSGVPVLIGLLESDQALLRDYALELLEMITGEQHGKSLEAWEEWWESRMHLPTID